LRPISLSSAAELEWDRLLLPDPREPAYAPRSLAGSRTHAAQLAGDALGQQTNTTHLTLTLAVRFHLPIHQLVYFAGREE
jgi:hypothetical protein